MSRQIRIEDIARPVLRLPFVNVLPVVLEDRRIVAAVNYSGMGDAAFLFLVDLEHLTDRRFPLPPGERGAYGFVAGPDGHLYLGTFSGRVYRFDLDRHTFTLLVHPFTQGQMTWGGYTSRAGRIYMGVYPTGEFCEVDPACGTSTVFAPLAASETGCYAASFFERADGTILVAISGSCPAIVRYDPKERRCRTVLALDPEDACTIRFQCRFDESRLMVAINGTLKLLDEATGLLAGDFPAPMHEKVNQAVRAADAYYLIGFSGKLYRCQDGRTEVLSMDLPQSGGLNYLLRLRNGAFIGMTDNGLLIQFDAPTGRQIRHQIDNVCDHGMHIMFLEKPPGQDVVIGGHYICMQMFRIDLKTQTYESSLEKVSPFPGQMHCGTCVGGTVYLGSYGKAVVYAYHSDAPFAVGANPRLLGLIGHEQNRPIRMVNDGHSVYIASKAEYGKLGGAITVLDPATERLEVYRHFVPDHNPTSLFYHGSRRLLVGTTQTMGDCGSRRPTTETAVVFLWDPATRQTVHTSQPWKAPVINAAALSPAGVLIGFGEGHYYLFDVVTRQYTIREWSGECLAGAFMSDGGFYGVTPDRLFRLDVTTGEVRPMAAISLTYGMAFEKISDTEILFADNDTTIKRIVLVGTE